MASGSDNTALSVSSKDSEAALIDYGRAILDLEARAVLQSVPLLGPSFAQAATTILSIKPGGRLVVSGMGKAGFVAMKVSATFASTGTPSFFLHPAEGAHGDLGRYTKGDIALFFSNSGETEEIIRVIGVLKRLGCPIISVTSQLKSTLARHSDTVIEIPKLEEAGPLAVAPTASTTAMLAMGDALAMAVLSRKQFSKEEFALYHPRGNLGRRLMLVTDIMRHGAQHPILQDSAPTKQVIHAITIAPGRPGAASIIDGNGKLAGIFTDGNLRRCVEQGGEFLEKPVASVMTRSPKTIHVSRMVEEAARILSEHKIDQLIVLDDAQRPVGLIDIQDIVDVRI